MATEQYPIKNRWSGEVIFTASIECAADTLPSIKLGLAVKAAVTAGANLADANLARANLADAYLADAYLAHANLAGAYLAGANLAGAYLAGADLAGAYLAHANLAGANLAGAYLAHANLADAYLAGANLADAYLADANLADANLARANLADAYLAGADLADAKGITDEQLRPIIADYWMILSMAQAEVPALVTALRNGKVDGSTYEGACACLVGTLENSGAKGLPHVSTSPAERWFAAIKKGDKPGDDSAGGFASQKALAWALDYCRLTGIELGAAA